MRRRSDIETLGARRAVTLVEILVAIGVIGVLLTLLAPTLRGARVQAGETRSLSNARGIVGDIQQYATVNGERFPAAEVGAFYQTNVAGSPIRVSTPDRWASARLWPAIIRDVAPWDERLASWVSGPFDADEHEGRSFVPSYDYSNSFVAPARVWSDSPPAAMPASEVESRSWDVRTSQVAFPAAKAMVWDDAQTYNPRPSPRLPDGAPGGPTPIGFADGHAAMHAPVSATAPAVNVLNANVWRASRLHNTRDGAQGRDY